MKKSTLVKNSILNFLYNLSNAIFPLISVSYASHVIRDEGIGRVASAQNIVQYFVVFASLGIPNYGVREIAKCNSCSIKKNKLFTELFLLNTISTTIFTCLYYLMIYNVEVFRSELILYQVVGITIVCNFINIDWIYQGTEEFRFIAIRNIVVKCIAVVILFIVVNDVDDYIKYAAIFVISVGGNYLLNIINLRKKDISLNINKDICIKHHVKPVAILLLTSFAIELYTLFDTTMITFFCEASNVAYYNNSIKLVRLIIVLAVSIGGVLLPRLSVYKEHEDHVRCNELVSSAFEIIWCILLPCGIGLLLVSDEIVVVLFGESFIPAIFTLRIAVLLIYTLGFSNLFGTQVLITFDSEAKLLFATIVGAIINIVLNWVLIPQYKENGAVVASVISEGVVTIITMLFALRCIQIQLQKGVIKSSLISVVVMSCVLLGIKHLVHDVEIRLVLMVLFGVFVYFSVNVLMRNPIADKIWQQIKKEMLCQ